MVEIFTVGGGDYLVNVFQAVAAWTGSGGYKSLLQVVMVMGLGLSAITLAFNQDWRAWINWFLGATLIYSCLMVPRLDVHVTDRLNPSLAPANVSNVPLGLALMASFTSQVGDYLTGSAEVVFGLPGDLNYSKNGMIYGARLYDATRSLRISDPEFAANLDEHFRQCVFYDVLLGRYSMKELAETSDIWTTIAPGSQARAQRFLTRDTGTGQVTSNIITCREAYDALNAQWAGLIDGMGTVFGRQLYPNQTAALAKAKLFADLPVAYQYLTGVSANATEIFKQTLTINAMSQAMHSMAATSGAGNIDVYAQTRADIQTERTYGSIASNAMKWVPLLNVVLTVLFYALFPVLFPLFLLPKTGPLALKGYVTGFFYLAAWGPLFVILHMMLMYKGASDMSAVAGSNGLSLASFTGMADVNSDIGLLAGYLIASVPFLAGGVAKGAMAISHHATSYLNPSQNAAEEAAREASTGNVSLGNTSFENSSVLTRQFAQGTIAPSFTYGAAQTRTFSDTGSMTTSFPEASYDQLPNSSYPFTPSLGQEFTSRLSTMASQARSNSESYANIATESTTSAVTKFRELRSQFSRGSAFESTTGTSNSDSIQTAFNEVDQASTNLQRQFGLSRRAADDISTAWFLGGEAGANAGVTNGVLSANVGAKAGGTRTWTDSDIGIASEDRSRIFGSLAQMSDSRNWSSTRDGFVRSVSTSSSSSISSTASGMNASLTEAQSYSREARRAEELANRLESQASFFEGNSAAGSLNLSQAYREWGLVEIERNRDFYGNVRFDDLTFQLSPEGQALQGKFIESYAEQLRDGIEDRLVLTSGQPISRPTVSGPGYVRSRAQIGGGSSGSVPQVNPGTIHDEVLRAQDAGRQRIRGPRGRLDAVTKGAQGASAESADEVKEW
ncbi:conjugal transfer protein TraG N-terminal domain-containing protein [Novosphingobium pentaromativorans]|uniref:Conjugal transfer mating pair stabilization protein TraG n=1 Tax=Novosphingobium pentaromativorans US6-1 TaxID=1088721 RepID=G6EF50_9SPHN|nr:conjugal transfer protein TraG N-terminal domain-containing protein [Novosphingobium pentaromativorans]AIT79223.1 conjugal transfer protein TraG [Novosphingobium pentaromativorans US6-1]EHJ60103.1 conjugal transfer mating pair stabilization protein TraG [Novosphingobium pentaromativorans US6-1]